MSRSSSFGLSFPSARCRWERIKKAVGASPTARDRLRFIESPEAFFWSDVKL